MPRMSNPQARPLWGGGPRQAHGGQSACQPSRGMEAWEGGGSLDVLASGGRAQRLGQDLTDAPRGPERPGLAWPPGLQRRGSGSGSGAAGAGRGQGRWSPGGLCHQSEEEQAWLADDVGRGRGGREST